MSRDQKFFDMYSIVLGVSALALVALFVVAMKMADLTQGVYTRDTAEFKAASIRVDKLDASSLRV